MRSIRVFNGGLASGAGGGASGGNERQLAGRYVEVYGYDNDDRAMARVAGKEQCRIVGLGQDGGVEDGHQEYERLVEAAVAAAEAEEEVGDNGDGDGDYGLQHGDLSGDEHPALWQLDECFLRGEGDKASNGRDDWTEIATMALLSAWGERYLRLSRGSLRLEDWGEVARLVSAGSNMPKTDVQCKNRIDTLKKKYKSEKQKQAAIGSSVSKWPFYAALDRLLNTAREHGGLPGAVDAGEMIKTRHSWKDCDEDDDTTSTSGSMEASSDEDRKRPRKRKFKDAAAIKELSNAILKFGEIYERIESSKQQQMLDLEKVRMEFARDLELHRMQLLMQTQIEVAKVKHSGIDGDISDHGVLAAINLERSTNF